MSTLEGRRLEADFCLQRPSARDLLKHKFVRMAKKTSYLTELIERHQRWKDEGGEQKEEEDAANDEIA